MLELSGCFTSIIIYNIRIVSKHGANKEKGDGCFGHINIIQD